MFLKPFRIKTQTAIKGSDRKKLRAEVAKEFKDFSQDDLREMIPNKEEMSIMKIATHSEDVVTVYCLQKTPIFFETNRTIYPTVYTLWKYPNALPAITTWPPVLKNISKGADLMLPGVIVNGEVTPKNLGKLTKGQSCSVKLLGNKAPIAVGKTAMSSSDMYASAMRGKGVVIMHSYEDLLWSHGDQSHPPLIEDVEMVEAVRKKHDGEDGNIAASDTNTKGTSDGHADVAALTLSSEINAVDPNEEDRQSDTDDRPNDEGHSDKGAEGNSRTPQELMDDLMEFCFKCALKSKVKKSDLPLLTSKFFKSCMQPFCPAGETLDVKRSRDKKLGKFLQRMQKDGYIKVKELSKGVESIIEYDKGHLGLRGLEVLDVSDTQTEQQTDDTDTFVPPQIVELYTVTAVSLPLFKELGSDKRKGHPLTVEELRQYAIEYIKSKELQNGSQVTLDFILASIVLNKSEYLETMRWDDLFIRLLNKLSPAYQYTIPGQPPVLKKGKLEPVTFKIQQRAGSKKVTLVHNLELFGINPQQFSHTVQKGVACSAALVPVAGKPNMCEVVVQGNQINFIASLLFDKYHLPKKYLQGLEQAPKSGKKKR